MILPLPDLPATEQLAEKLASRLGAGDMLALSGELGAGKTSFARALLRALGVFDEVPSPTFTLLQNYDLPGLRVSHFDLYRLRDSTELDELGWDDALTESLVIVEWPERAGPRLPHDYLALHFNLDAKGRNVTLTPHGGWTERLAKALA
jgi:tRNA threonylcarbamoyl adenosine modification protein YjeE